MMTDRDLAYSTGLCYNLGLMGLVHMEPQRSAIGYSESAEAR